MTKRHNKASIGKTKQNRLCRVPEQTADFPNWKMPFRLEWESKLFMFAFEEMQFPSQVKISPRIYIDGIDSTIKKYQNQPWQARKSHDTRSIIEVRENVCFACTEEVIPSSTR